MGHESLYGALHSGAQQALGCEGQLQHTLLEALGRTSLLQTLDCTCSRRVFHLYTAQPCDRVAQGAASSSEVGNTPEGSVSQRDRARGCDTDVAESVDMIGLYGR